MLREVIGCYFFFLGNEASKNAFHLTTGRPRSDPSFLVTLISGGIAGVAYWTSIFPLDTIKSKVQVGGSVAQAGLVKIGLEMWRHGGMKVFYRGLAPCALRAFPVGAVMFLTYEYSKILLLR